MGWGLEIVAKEFDAELKRWDLKLDVQRGILVTPDIAIKLRLDLSTAKYRKILRTEINKEVARDKARRQAKQTSLLDEITEGNHGNNSNNRRSIQRNASH